MFTVTACFFPGLRGRQKDCSTNLILRTPMCTRPGQVPNKCEWKRGDQITYISYETTRLKKLAPESTDNYADDGSANGSHADDWSVGFCDDGVGDAQQQTEA